MLSINTTEGKNKNSPCQICIIKVLCKQKCLQLLEFRWNFEKIYYGANEKTIQKR